MCYGLAISPIRDICVHGDQQLLCTLLPTQMGSYPRGKRCIFIHYSKNSKRYLFLKEQEGESMTKIESPDANFLGFEPTKGKVWRASSWMRVQQVAQLSKKILSLRLLKTVELVSCGLCNVTITRISNVTSKQP